MTQRIKFHEKGIGQNYMTEEYTISFDDKPQEASWGIIGRGVGEFNTQQAGDDAGERLCFVLKAPDEEIVGGVIGAVYWGDWFSLDLIWVKEALRGRGYGHRLLTMVEDEARKRGAKNVFLDTFSFQAPDFYKQRGYEVFGELPDFPEGHQRFYMKKRL